MPLCDAALGNLWTYDGEAGRLAAIRGASPEYRAELMRAGPQKPEPGGSLIRVVEGEPLVHIADITIELNEAVAREAAMAEVLGVINSSSGDLVPVFDAMLERPGTTTAPATSSAACWPTARARGPCCGCRYARTARC